MADENGSSSSQENNDSEDSPPLLPASPENIFEVETIIGRMKYEGEMRYKVRWKGYGPADDTWEPERNLSTCCYDIIAAYNKKQDEIAKKRSEERKRKQAIREGRIPPEPTEGAAGYSQYPPNFKNEFYDRLDSGKVDFTYDKDMYSKVKVRGQSKSSETDDKQKTDSPDTGSDRKRQKARRRTGPTPGSSKQSSGKAKSTTKTTQKHTSHSKRKKPSAGKHRIANRNLAIYTDSETDSDLQETSAEKLSCSTESVSSSGNESNEGQEARPGLGGSECTVGEEQKVGWGEFSKDMTSTEYSNVSVSEGAAVGQEDRPGSGGGESTAMATGDGEATEKPMPSSDETINYSFSSVSDADASRLSARMQDVDVSPVTKAKLFQSTADKDDGHDKKKKKKKKRSSKDRKHHRRKASSSEASQSSSPAERKRKLTESSVPEIAGKVQKAEHWEDIEPSFEGTMQADVSVKTEHSSPEKSDEYVWLGSCKPEPQKDDDEDSSGSVEQGTGNNVKQESDGCHPYTPEQGTGNNVKQESDGCHPCTSAQGTSMDSYDVVDSDQPEPMDVKEEREEMEATSDVVPGTSIFEEPFPKASGDSTVFPDFKSSIDLNNIKHLQLARSHSRDSLTRVKTDECGDSSAGSSPRSGDIKKDLKFSRTDSADTRDSGINSPGSELGMASSVGGQSDKAGSDLGISSLVGGEVDGSGSELGMASLAAGQVVKVGSELDMASSVAGQDEKMAVQAPMEDFPVRAVVMDQDELEIDLDDSGWDFLRMRMNLPNVENLTLTNSEFADALKAGDYQLVKDSLNNTSQEYDIEQSDSTGITLLTYAIQNRYDDIVELLLQHGAYVNARNMAGMTPLMTACQQNLSSLVALLLRHGANVNMQCLSGESALMMSAMEGNRQIVRTLLQHGANFNLVTSSGFSAWSYISGTNHCDIESSLILHRDRLFSSFWKAICCIKQFFTPKHLTPMFAPQLFNVRDGEQFQMIFHNNHCQNQPGFLFIGHTHMREEEMQVALWGQCAVESVVMNGYQQDPFHKIGNFGFVIKEFLVGKNVLQINPLKWAPEDTRTLVVCLYQ